MSQPPIDRARLTVSGPQRLSGGCSGPIGYLAHDGPVFVGTLPGVDHLGQLRWDRFLPTVDGNVNPAAFD